MKPALRLLLLSLAPWALALACIVLARACVPAPAPWPGEACEMPAVGIEFNPNFGTLET